MNERVKELAEQCGLKILSDTDNSIDAVISYAEIV